MDVTRHICQSRLGKILLAALCLLVWIFSLVNAARGQETAQGGIRGVVMDADFNVPVPGVRVSVSETDKRASTSDDGSFVLSGLVPGSYTLVFVKEGYQREVRPGVVVAAGALTELDPRLAGEFTDMDEMVVNDIQIGGPSEGGLLQVRMQQTALMDAIGADMMSKAGAGTAAAALKLVTGASVQDGKYAVIRGLSDRYTSTMLNGVRLPTSDKDRRAVQMDLFPAAMIESIQITKSFLPDQQADASGGGIDIITRGIPEKTVLSASVSIEHDTAATGNPDFMSYAGGGNDFGGHRGTGRSLFWKEGDLTDPRGFSERYGNELVNREPGPNYGFKFAAGDVWTLGAETSAGALINGSYGQKYKFRESIKQGIRNDGGTQATNVITDTDNTAFIETSTDEQLWSIGLTTGIKTPDHEIKFTGLYTHQARDVVEMRYDEDQPISTSFKTNIVRGKITGYEDHAWRGRAVNGVMQFSETGNGSAQLAGKHKFEELNEMEIDWTGAYNVSESIEPDRRSFKGGYVYDKLLKYDKNQVLISSNEINQIALDEYQRRWQDTREESRQGQVNIRVPFKLMGQDGYLKGGIFDDAMDRTFRNRIFTPANSVQIPALDEYDFSQFGVLDNLPLGGLNDTSIEYDARQELSACYAMMRAPLPEWIDLIGGVRVERTVMRTSVWTPDKETLWLYRVGRDPANVNTFGSVYYESNVSNELAAVSIDQTDVLPAVSLTLKPTRDISMRLAYGETIARPTFKELTPVLYQEFDSSRIFLGNPELGISNLKNYDVRIEWRPPGKTDILAASYFNKTIEGPIQYTVYKGFAGGSEDYIVPENYASGEVSGFELEARKDLGFICEELKGLSLGANATIQSSIVEYTEGLQQTLLNAGVTATTRPMDGQPDLLYNINLVYENKWLTVGAFYNHKGETYVAGESWSGSKGYVPNIVELPVDSLDITLGLKFGGIWRLGIDVKNVLDPTIRSVYKGPMGELPNTTYKQGRTYSMSLGCSF